MPKDLKPRMEDGDIKAIEEILDDCIFNEMDVLEWGGGVSSKYFSDYLRNKVGVDTYTWTVIEHSWKWADWILRNARKITALHYIPILEEYFRYKDDYKYDLIIIDGRERVKCFRQARKMLNVGGEILLHDAWREEYKEVMDNGKLLTKNLWIETN